MPSIIMTDGHNSKRKCEMSKEGALIKKKNQIFFIYREIQSRAVAKSYMRKGS
jgi:uncharacterized beta-barrel protein YwiB (DUF1934 family)